MRTPIHEGSERPYYSYMLLLVDSQNGLSTGQEMLTVDESLSQMCASIPGRIVEGFARLSLRPVSEALGFELRVQSRLRMLDPAKEMLFQFVAAGPV